MHVAYECSQILKLTEVQIESIASYNDNILVGTRQGHLMMYSVSRRADGERQNVQLLRYNKNFSKKPIQQLAIINEYDLIVKLSDNIISTHELSSTNFILLKTLAKTKGATYFALDVKTHVTLSGDKSITVRLAVVVKKKLQIYYLKSREFHELRDFQLSDIPRIVTWAGDTLCIGYKGSYSLLQTLKGEQTELFPMGRHQEPTITTVSNDTFALGNDSQAVFMNTKGDPTVHSSVKWTDIPHALGYDEPYLIGLLNNCVEVRCWDIEQNNRIQEIKIAGRLIDVTAQGVVYIASNDFVWLIHFVPIPKQIKVLLQEKRFELALKLANISEDTEDEKKGNICQIQTLYAFDLFHNRKFDKAMDEFLKLETDPYEVIRLFPSLLPKQARPPGDIGPKFDDGELENGLVALISYLTEVRLKLHVGSDTVSKSTQLLMQIIDTTLLKCYLQTNDALVAPLLRRNYCNLDEAETTLKMYEKYSELVILYQTNGLHKKALELLRSQANQPESALRGHERTIHYLQNLGKEHIDLIFEFSSWILEAHPEEGLKIFVEDSPEVENLPRPKVLDFLLKTKKHFLVIPYLEHVIHVWEDTNSIFHNALVHEYLQRIKELGGESSAQHVRNKLLSFLEKSDHYSPESVLIHFPDDSLLEERAIVNGKLGRHEHALGIYVSLLGNYNRAIDYCDKVYTSGGGGNVYVQLLTLLISPPDTLPGISRNVMARSPPLPDLETALSLLESWGTRVPPIEALKQIPDKVPVTSLGHFLSSSLRAQLDIRRKKELLKGLLHAEYLQIQEQRMRLEATTIVMQDSNVCPVCKKRFSDQSAFVRFPNGDIVHYSCQEKMT